MEWGGVETRPIFGATQRVLSGRVVVWCDVA